MTTKMGSSRPTQVTVSVLVVNFNGRTFLQRCLDSLAAQTFGCFEVLVMDNGSQDGSLETLVLPDARFRLFRLGRNVGFAAANNLGASLARGKWLAMLNPDAFPEADWLLSLMAATKRHPRAALFGSTQLLDRAPQWLDGSGDVYSFLGLAWRGNHLHPLRDLPPEGETFSPCAAAALYRADVFRALGGFDESYFCYFEDVDLGFRFRLAGHHCVQVREALVRHVGGGISGQESPLAVYLGHRNSLWTHIKDMPSALLPFTLPAQVLSELVLILRGVLRQRQGWRGHGSASREFSVARWRALRHGLLHSGAAWRQRGATQQGRQATTWQLARALCWSLSKLRQRAHDVRPITKLPFKWR